MQVDKLADQVGKEVTVCEGMRIIHAVRISGRPIEEPLTFNYLRGSGPEVVVQIRTRGGELRTWDLTAIVNADPNDFKKGGKLDGLKDFAEVMMDSSRPVITLRSLIIEHSAGILPPEKLQSRPRVKLDQMATHSRVQAN